MNCGPVLSLRSQFFHNRLFFSPAGATQDCQKGAPTCCSTWPHYALWVAERHQQASQRFHWSLLAYLMNKDQRLSWLRHVSPPGFTFTYG
jgi:hypothetical protein